MYYLNDGPKTIALTIDDGPNATYTPQVLKLLQKYKVKATFSMIGTECGCRPLGWPARWPTPGTRSSTTPGPTPTCPG